jgi:hypothetical protein
LDYEALELIVAEILVRISTERWYKAARRPLAEFEATGPSAEATPENWALREEREQSSRRLLASSQTPACSLGNRPHLAR